MAKVIPIGEPVNDAERRAIAHLRDHLPDSYLVLHNFEVHRRDEKFEVDIAVIAPHAVYLVDAKGTRGLIDVHGPKWYPERRAPFASPLLKLRGHARAIKGAITDSNPQRRELGGLYVDAVVLLTSPDADLRDPGGRDAPDVASLVKSASFFQDKGRIPQQYQTNVLPLQSLVLKALQGVAKKRTGPLRFGSWEVEERLGGTDSYTEYRAYNLFAGPAAGHVRLRLYRADPYLPAEEREAQRKRIGNAYEALSRLPPHPGIVGARDFFPTEGEEGYVLVTEDVPGQALRLRMDQPNRDRPNLALTLDQKVSLARDLLEALDHAHRQGVVHRNLTPSVVLLGEDGQARLTGFEYARPKADRSHTMAREIVDDLDPAYLAPECFGEPEAASTASDVFSAGLLFYELFAGERAFASQTEIFDADAVFPQPPSALRGELTAAFDAWLQRLCTFDPDQRPSAKQVLEGLETLSAPEDEDASSAVSETRESESAPEPEPPPLDYAKLQPGAQLTHKYVIQKRLGRPGSFGVVYQVVDTLGDVARVVKLILRDRHSTLERLKKEYRTLLRVPDHPNVVRVIDADLLPGGGPPFIVFDYIEGLDVGDMIEEGLFSPDDALSFARQVVEGLVHLHRNDVYHCDIKPRNLLWTSQGTKIIDFNVSVLSTGNGGQGGGSRRYLPPDIDLAVGPSTADLADRDLYALGLTLYEALTGRYPWDSSTPPAGKAAIDPRELSGFEDLAPELVTILLKAIAPKRGDRYASATDLQTDLERLKQARRAPSPVSERISVTEALLPDSGTTAPNTNPFLAYLLTLYSQSSHSNSGTRGLDEMGRHLYVETALDRELTPAVLAGELRLVLITGNAGDGKTAFLQRFEDLARERGAEMAEPLVNGSRFSLEGRGYSINYDGSQDEGERQSDEVLRAFFTPFAGTDSAGWSQGETRLIAINEGRLVDFLAGEREQFPLLAGLVQRGLMTAAPEHGVAVVNLNLRSVVARPNDEIADGAAVADPARSILQRLLRRMTHPSLWRPCHDCDLRERCYVLHNVRTLQDETAGPKIIERLQTLYTLTHLRGRLHITLRDLGSALAFMLAGTRDCAEIHQLYAAGRRNEIAQAYYFNSWMGGDVETADRLLSLLKDVDPGRATDPRLDRNLGFVTPAQDGSLFGFADRGGYDREILQRLFEDLPGDFSGQPGIPKVKAHQSYVAMARRRSYFERRDNGWRGMLPYRSGNRLLGIVQAREIPAGLLSELLEGINRGEGLTNPRRLGGSLALKVRDVERGTIRSYRLFPAERFSVAVQDEAARARFVEQLPAMLVLRYRSDATADAELNINLDVFEMLQRLNAGYRPTVEEEQGYYLSLAVFKNLLGSAPYQEVLLTTTGHDFFRIERRDDGRLEMDRLARGVG